MIFRGLLLIAVLGGAPAAFAQSGQPAGSLANQLETCRQHVIQLTEQSRTQQTKLASLRTERKAIGTSGGEVARFKLANLDNELKELSKQNQTVNAQIDSEKKRCDSLASRVSSGSRGGTQGQPSGR